MPDAANSNTILGLFGPMAILAVLALNAMLVWSRRHSFADALLGRGFAVQVRGSADRGPSKVVGTNVVAFGHRNSVSRAGLSQRAPMSRLAA